MLYMGFFKYIYPRRRTKLVPAVISRFSGAPEASAQQGGPTSGS